MRIINNGVMFPLTDVGLQIPANSYLTITQANLHLLRNSAILLSAIINGTLIIGDTDYEIDDISMAVSMLYNILFIYNNTQNNIEIEDIGITIVPAEHYRYIDINKLKLSSDILTLLNNGSVLFSDGLRYLSLVEAISLIHGTNSIQIQDSVTSDASNKLNIPVTFDPLRQKLLSIGFETFTNEAITVRPYDGLKFSYIFGSSGLCWIAPLKGTIVGYSFSASRNSATDLLLYVNNTSHGLLTTVSNELIQSSYSVNIDFEMNDKLKIKAGAIADSDEVVVSIMLKWRM
jgi:hypothetical protein